MILRIPEVTTKKIQYEDGVETGSTGGLSLISLLVIVTVRFTVSVLLLKAQPANLTLSFAMECQRRLKRKC